MTTLEEFRGLFPALERYVWLNSPTAPPAARPVYETVQAVQAEWLEGKMDWHAWEEHAFASRPLFASLIGAEADDIALESSVSSAAATVAASLPPGRVVVGAPEFRSNLFPWLALRDRGFEVVELPANEHGVVPTDAMLAEITDGTVLVALSSVQSSNGYRARLDDVVERTHAVGGRVFVDACQSLGALRLDVRATPVDYVSTHGYKWLLSPRGAAWFYVRPERLEETRVLVPSWRSVDDPYADYYGGPMELSKTARKHDASLAWFSWPGARAALELLASLDAGEVERRCLELAAAFREGAAARGFAAVPEELPSQIVGIEVPDPGALIERLRERRVVAAVRGGFLRVGFHAFNDRTDVETALDALGSA